MVGMTGVEPAWASSQNWWVTVTLHPGYQDKEVRLSRREDNRLNFTLVAGIGFEPIYLGYEPNELPDYSILR